MARIHELKTWPSPFAAVMQGAKVHEIRVDDRGFIVGDRLHLFEWSPSEGYSGRMIAAVVTYKSSGGTWGLPPDLCVMSIKVFGLDSNLRYPALTEGSLRDDFTEPSK